jgi:predicted transposase YbfD/YdcC
MLKLKGTIVTTDALNCQRAIKAATPTLMSEPLTWSFGELRKQFSENPPDWLRDETVKGYYRALAPSQVGDLTKMLLVEIKPDDIRAVREKIESREKKAKQISPSKRSKPFLRMRRSPRIGFSPESGPRTTRQFK